MFGLSKVDKIKNHYAIEEVIRSYGIILKGSEQSLKGFCPFHNDSKTPSLSVSAEKGLWNCFVCPNTGGTVIDFVARKQGISDKEAIDQLFAAAEGSPAYPPESSQLKPEEEKQTLAFNHLLDEVAKIYHTSFLSHAKAQEYLTGRGFTDKRLWEKYQIGYADGGSLKKILPEEGEIIDFLKEKGILNAKGNEAFYKCVVIPIKRQGQVVGLYGRSVEGERQMYLKGKRQGVWNAEAIEAYDSLFLTESILDALSLVQLGFPNTLALYGVNGFTEDHQRLLESKGLAEIILVLDNDKAGKDAGERMKKVLSPLSIVLSSITLPDGFKDPNEFLIAGGSKETFEELVKQRTSHQPPPKAESTKATHGLLTHHDQEATFVYGNLSYHLKGWKRETFDSLRVVITATHQEKTHIDRIDLYLSKSRMTFAKQVAQKLEVKVEEVEEHLRQMTQTLEGLKEQAEESQKNDEKSSSSMNERDRKEALALLKDPDLLNLILRDLDICGYVGEETAKKLCYLSASSRMTQQPMSVIVRSSSAAGKSDLMEKVAELMPPEQMEFYSRMTPQALYYMDKHQLQHKLVIIDERSGSEEADYPIRTLQSKAKLVLAVVFKDPNSGKSRTEKIEVLGPCAMWESTTQAELNNENTSRCFEIWLDESEEQTRRIHEAQREEFGAEGQARRREKTKIIQLHQNAQRLLKNVEVEIPYRHSLSFPVSNMRTRRDHRRFLCLISVIAMLHQYQRPLQKGEGGEALIQATLDDYKEAYHMAHAALRISLSPLPKDAEDLLKKIFAMIEEKQGKIDLDYSFSRREVREWTSFSEAKVRRGLSELVSLEYLTPLMGKQGRSYRYKLAVTPGTFSDILEGLTTPEELESLLKKKEGA